MPDSLFPCTLCCPERWVQVRTERRPAARDFLPCVRGVMLEIAILERSIYVEGTVVGLATDAPSPLSRGPVGCAAKAR